MLWLLFNRITRLSHSAESQKLYHSGDDGENYLPMCQNLLVQWSHTRAKRGKLPMLLGRRDGMLAVLSSTTTLASGHLWAHVCTKDKTVFNLGVHYPTMWWSMSNRLKCSFSCLGEYMFKPSLSLIGCYPMIRASWPVCGREDPGNQIREKITILLYKV